MRQFLCGCLVGAALFGGFESFASDRHQQQPSLQRDYDRYRQMQQQLDIRRMRDMMERERFDKSLGLGRKPC